MRFFLNWLLFFSFGASLHAQDFSFSGYVIDETTGENLIGANIFVQNSPDVGTTSNVYGFYSLSLDGGEQTIVVSYLGYEDLIMTINVVEDRVLDMKLRPGLQIEEVVISAEKEEKDQNVQSTEMGKIELPIENIKLLPVLFGEVDILKSLQWLPGVLSSGEGSSGFYVRGGAADQNLVLLDEAVVYNTGHLLGFFSVFNADAIKNTTLIKGNMPANYGGRLSSVVDIQMKDGNKQHLNIEGGIGLVASRLTIEGPIKKEESSFIISARRTYVLDLAQPAIKGTDFAGTNYYFYDVNAKVNHRISDKDRLFFSSYFGRDVFRFRQPTRDLSFDMPYGNSTATFRWNHVYNNKTFMNLSLIYNDYNFSFSGKQDDFNFKVASGVQDWTAKLDFDYFMNNRHHIKYGVNYTYHTLTPNSGTATIDDVDFSTDFTDKYGQELALYLLDDIKISPALSLNIGLRYGFFQQLGPYDSKLNGQTYKSFETVKFYDGLEPRMSFKYALNPSFSLKAGVSKANQYLHLVSNSSSTLPADIWVPSTEIVKPQSSIQYALGLFKNWQDDNYESSIEFYYKDLNNQLDYAESYVDNLSNEVEDAFVVGQGRSYGAEFFLKKNSGKLNGWIGYTLSKTERSFPDVEQGRWYPTVYDRRHDMSIVANYKISKKFDIGATFIYGTGRYFTPYDAFYFIEGGISPSYGPRNSAQLEDYHRLDISFNYRPKVKKEKKFYGTWNISFYNIYNRKNPFFLYYDTDVDQGQGTVELSAKKVTIFPIIPSITYNFNWQP